MRYFVSYFFTKDTINRGFGNAEVEIAKTINFNEIAQIQKELENKYKFKKVAILNYKEMGE